MEYLKDSMQNCLVGVILQERAKNDETLQTHRSVFWPVIENDITTIVT